MGRWMHKVVNVSALDKSVLEASLTGLGIDGWELISVDNGMAYLKKSDIPPSDSMQTVPHQKFDAPSAHPQAAGSSTPDVESPWYWLPRSEVGEKRYEAVTSQDTGIVALAHKHRVVVILGSDRKVVRGKTDNVLGHEHNVSVLGSVEESDGHSHTFETFP